MGRRSLTTLVRSARWIGQARPSSQRVLERSRGSRTVLGREFGEMTRMGTMGDDGASAVGWWRMANGGVPYRYLVAGRVLISSTPVRRSRPQHGTSDGWSGRGIDPGIKPVRST